MSNTGTVMILLYGPYGFRILHKPYYLSKKGRMCFMYGAGLFEGMKQERLGQFHCEMPKCAADPLSMVMYTLPEDFHKSKGEFLRLVLKHIRKRAEAFVAGKIAHKVAV